MRLPVLTMVGDQQAALAGLSDGKPERVALNFGTGAFFLYATNQRPIHSVLPYSVAWNTTSTTAFLSEGTVHRVAPALDSFAENVLIDRAALAESLARGRMGHTLVLPAREGLGSPYWDPRRRTEIAGSSNHHDVALGLVHAFGFMIRDNLDAASQGARPKDFLMGGGLSRQPHVVQALADAIGVGLTIVKESEVTVRGAAALATPGSWPAPESWITYRPRVAENVRRETHDLWHETFRMNVAPT